AGRATFATAALGVGSHTITAVYGGDSTSAKSTSNPVVETIVTGPRVTSVHRFGFHTRPTTLILSFSQPLDPAQAQDVQNYRIRGPLGRRIRIASATYDLRAGTVTLAPARRLDLHRRYKLTVSGTTTGGLTGIAGQPLDGAGDGGVGSDFRTSLT